VPHRRLVAAFLSVQNRELPPVSSSPSRSTSLATQRNCSSTLSDGVTSGVVHHGHQYNARNIAYPRPKCALAQRATSVVTQQHVADMSIHVSLAITSLHSPVKHSSSHNSSPLPPQTPGGHFCFGELPQSLDNSSMSFSCNMIVKYGMKCPWMPSERERREKKREENNVSTSHIGLMPCSDCSLQNT
jgi:hypothetical protein